jgi:DNA-binding NarL/FixJ family response regulator
MSNIDYLSDADGQRLVDAIDLAGGFHDKTRALINGLLFDDECENFFNAGRRWAARLSKRESDVVIMKLRGLSFYRIADILGLHPSSTKTYWRRAMGKKPSI